MNEDENEEEVVEDAVVFVEREETLEERMASAARIGVAVASRFFEDFRDPASGFRGPKFVWPTTLQKMVAEHAPIQCACAGLEEPECIQACNDAAAARLEVLLAEEMRKR